MGIEQVPSGVSVPEDLSGLRDEIDRLDVEINDKEVELFDAEKRGVSEKILEKKKNNIRELEKERDVVIEKVKKLGFDVDEEGIFDPNNPDFYVD